MTHLPFSCCRHYYADQITSQRARANWKCLDASVIIVSTSYEQTSTSTIRCVKMNEWMNSEWIESNQSRMNLILVSRWGCCGHCCVNTILFPSFHQNSRTYFMVQDNGPFSSRSKTETTADDNKCDTVGRLLRTGSTVLTPIKGRASTSTVNHKFIPFLVVTLLTCTTVRNSSLLRYSK